MKTLKTFKEYFKTDEFLGESDDLSKFQKNSKGQYVAEDMYGIRDLMYYHKISAKDIDISKVKDMTMLFSDYYRIPLDKDIEKWDVSHVTNMTEMFKGRSGIKNLDLSKWDVKNVENMRSMFEFSDFNGDISKWDVRKCENFDSMFRRNSTFNNKIPSNYVNAVKMSDMFSGCKSFNQQVEINAPKLKYMSYMFEDCHALDKQIEINAEKVESVEGVFARCSSLKTNPVLNVSKKADLGAAKLSSEYIIFNKYLSNK